MNENLKPNLNDGASNSNLKSNLNSTQKTSRIFFTVLAVSVLCAVLYLFKSYLLTIGIGVLLAIATSNVQNAFLRLTGGRRLLSAALCTVLLCAFFFLPFFYGVSRLVSAVSDLNVSSVQEAVDYVKNYEVPESLAFAREWINALLASVDFAKIGGEALSYARVLLGKSAGFIVDMCFIAIFFFFAHFYANELVAYVKRVAPLAKDDTERIFSEVSNTMSVVLYSTIANAVLEGFLFSIIAGFYGYDTLLFGVIFAFGSLIPMVGGLLVYLPLSLYELSLGHAASAAVIFIYSVLVISTLADSFIKPLVIKFINEKLVRHRAYLSELLIFFFFFSGITSFGFWGVILGPAIVTLCSAVLRLYEILKDRELL